MKKSFLGSNGAKMNIGTGGADVSYGKVSSAIAGLSDTGKIARAKIDNMFGKKERLSTLNAINLSSYTSEASLKLAQRIWNDEINVAYADLNGDNGKYEIGSNTLTLSNALLGGKTKEENAKLAAVIDHEGTHLNGNRYEALAHIKAYQTYDAINSMFKLKGDSTFTEQMIGAITNPDSWKENTGGTDYWRVMKDGSIFDDGKDGVISFEDGRETIYTKNTGKQGSLEEYLGLEAGTGYSALQMSAAGFKYDGKTWKGGGTISANVIQGLVDNGLVDNGKITTQVKAPVEQKKTDKSFLQKVNDTIKPVIDSFKDDVTEKVKNAKRYIKTSIAGAYNYLTNKNTSNAPEQKIQTTIAENKYLTIKEQWDYITSPEFYGKFKAIVNKKTDDPSKQLDQLRTACNLFIDAAISEFGADVYKDIMPYGSQGPNELYTTWKNNDNLLQLGNSDDAWINAQKYADAGYIVLSAASNNENHVALVLRNGYSYNTIPNTDWKQREGYVVPQNSINYGGVMKSEWPAFLQAGSYTGIVAPRWAYSPDIIEKKKVHFFVYNGGKK